MKENSNDLNYNKKQLEITMKQRYNSRKKKVKVTKKQFFFTIIVVGILFSIIFISLKKDSDSMDSIKEYELDESYAQPIQDSQINNSLNDSIGGLGESLESSMAAFIILVVIFVILTSIMIIFISPFRRGFI